MPLGKYFVKRFVVVFQNYYIFIRRLIGHARQPMARAFQAFFGLRGLSIVPRAQGHSTLVGDVSRGLRL
ncbi:MAG TPA: hypothetical protein DEO91_03380 [Pseudomonas sp.]|nr:hypothetical protein [Pseudomonas sp.]